MKFKFYFDFVAADRLMGNLNLSHTQAHSDDYIHLQQPISQLHLRVDAQAMQSFTLQLHDQIKISLPAQQNIDILILNDEQQPAPELLIDESTPLTLLTDTAAQNTLLQLHQGTPSSLKLQQQLACKNISVAQLKQAKTLEYCECAIFRAAAPIQVLIFNTGPDAQVTEQQGRDEINIEIHYAQPILAYLPDPLAQPVQEIFIPRGSAKTYTVTTGQWIQIIDLSGKQCSDFLAFDADALAKGQEVGLDAMTTRTILGHSMPTPGLHSKFFAADMHAMVEVVQDTVGRHDMFLSACNAKFYHDSGYYSHVSCSENFNQILQQYGITARDAWPAINLFYNTFIQPCGSIGLAEPWSQPGDYVLLKAHRNLRCASSACPDDIDPSNGWVPTDIFVRIYDQNQYFPRSQHYRIDPKEQPRMTQASGFFSRISTLTSKVSEYHGYWIANEYDGWGAKAEYLACREHVAMIDLSALRKFDITGPDAEALLQYALTRNIRKLAIGEIVYSASCLDTGGMVDDGTLFRMGEHNFRWICGDEYSGTWLKQLAQQHGYKVSIRHVSAHIHNIALQGPKSRELLEKLIWTPEHQPNINTLAWFHFSLGKLVNEHGPSVMVSRTGYTGELGFEIWCHPNDAEQLWDTIWQQGQAYHLAPLGFDALDMLRIEAGLIFAQHEFSTATNPYEAGIGFTVAMKSKAEDFIGKQAMQNQSSASRHKLMGLVLEEHEIPQHGDQIYCGRFAIGVVTSATNSPQLGKPIALCRLAPQYATAGTSVEIGQLDGLRKRLKAQVVNLPFYDPERSRVRS